MHIDITNHRARITPPAVLLSVPLGNLRLSLAALAAYRLMRLSQFFEFHQCILRLEPSQVVKQQTCRHSLRCILLRYFKYSVMGLSLNRLPNRKCPCTKGWQKPLPVFEGEKGEKPAMISVTPWWWQSWLEAVLNLWSVSCVLILWHWWLHPLRNLYLFSLSYWFTCV